MGYLDYGNTFIVGMAGSGKSYFLHRVIMEAIEEETSLILVDPKAVEFTRYKNEDVLVEPIFRLNFVPNDILTSLTRHLEARDAGREAKDPLLLLIDEYAGIEAFDPTFSLSLAKLSPRLKEANITCMIATQKEDGLPTSLLETVDTKVAMRMMRSKFAFSYIGTKEPAFLPPHGKAVIARKGEEPTIIDIE